MNLQEYIKKNGNVEIEEKALNDLLGIKESKVWKPQQDDEYFYINSLGKIFDEAWSNSYYDKFCYAIGNYFKTKEEAEFMIERLKVIAQVKRFAIEHNECEIDWCYNKQGKYYIMYDFENEKMFYNYACVLKHNEIYFTSKEIAMNCVKEIGEDIIKKYYLGVVDVEERKE